MPCRRSSWFWVVGTLILSGLSWTARGADAGAPSTKQAQAILSRYCYECHGEGGKKGGVTLDEFEGDPAAAANRELWWKVLKNVRAGIMPPHKKDQPTAQERELLAGWIKYQAFGIDAAHPDPGRVTIRRLNRVEYRNTIRDLMGIDFNTTEEFPPDDTGYGFDTIGDVLSVSPLLLEKYMAAAETIVKNAVPIAPKVVAESTIAGKEFRSKEGPVAGDHLNFYKPASVETSFTAPQPGTYRLTLSFNVRGEFDFDPGKCNVIFSVDEEEAWRREDFGWANGERTHYEIPQKWQAGKHTFWLDLTPLTPIAKKVNSLELQVLSLKVEGPLEQNFWVAPPRYHKFFPREEPPTDAKERRVYAKEVLAAFAKRAFRRPADERMVDRLVKMAEPAWLHEGKRFEEGIGRAMVALLSSPRFLFRIEGNAAGHERDAFAPVDEYALASRLSYFLWSTMPDEELSALAERGELRSNLVAQVKRMMSDPRSKAMIDNFTGQWLQARDVEGISIDARTVLARDKGEEKELEKAQAEFRARLAQQQAQAKNGVPNPVLPQDQQKEQEQRRQRFRRLFQPAVELDGPLRDAMRAEPELFFSNLVRNDRSLSELVDCDYTYLNEKLAKHYGVPDVKGPDMRRVTLPKDSPRGGLLTMGAMLVVTSNPTRTSPVKRGQFILDNILGMPTPPPPADVPALEDSEKGISDHEPTLREVLAIHREKPLCSSCHNRMDPLGMSLENFNAMGMWREKERGEAIDASGQLITGENFKDARELKKVLKEKHLTQIYRCLTEKMLTYALGRGLDYYDVETVDRIVERLEKQDGRFSALLMGVIESPAFGERRNAAAVASPAARVETQKPVEGRIKS